MKKSIDLLIITVLSFILISGIVQGASIELLKPIWVEDWECYSTTADMEEAGWSLYGGGLGELTDVVNHTAGGYTCLKTGTGNSAPIRLADSGNYITGRVTAWMYCPQDSGVRRSAVFIWDGNDYIRVGVFEIYSSTNFFVLHSGHPYIITNIRANKGWHEIIFDVKSDGTKVCINGMEVYSTPDFTSFNKVLLGGTHVGTVPIYFDDITVEKYVPMEISSKVMYGYPNPFFYGDGIRFSYHPTNFGKAHIKIYNESGQEVFEELIGDVESEYNEFIWDGQDGKGAPVPCGIYSLIISIEMQDGSQEFIRGMVVKR